MGTQQFLVSQRCWSSGSQSGFLTSSTGLTWNLLEKKILRLYRELLHRNSGTGVQGPGFLEALQNVRVDEGSWASGTAMPPRPSLT